VLAKAKQLWPDAPAIQDADFAINLRFGNFEKTWRASGRPIDGGIAGYVRILRTPARRTSMPESSFAKSHRLSAGERQFVYQALPQMGRVDQDFEFMQQWPVEQDLSGQTYALFRPWLSKLRRDPRFMRLAKRLGLVAYWEQSGKWPDFCVEPGLPYECEERGREAQVKVVRWATKLAIFKALL
jgi:hypothetical protein